MAWEARWGLKRIILPQAQIAPPFWLNGLGSPLGIETRLVHLFQQVL